MYVRLVASLTGNQPYYNYIRGGLIPHLTKKGYSWKSMAPAIDLAVLKYRFHIDPVSSAHLDKMDKIDCGWTAPLPRVHHYDGATGLHVSLGPDCALKDVQYWVKQDGTTAKAASPAPPPLPWSNSVQGLTQHFEQMSMRNAVNPVDMGHIPDDATAEVSPIILKHDEISMELYTGHIFPAYELVPTSDRHHGTRLQIRAIGVQFNWTLNQEVVFSAALTGKPRRKQFFSQCCWKRCVIGTKSDYASAVNRVEWQQALQHGDLPSLQQTDSKDPMIFSPANNTEYLNVAAYLEAFWGYIWPATCHNYVPQHEEWRAPKHGGLKEFVDHVISTIRRAQIKHATECLRGVVTYPSGDQRQGRYRMTLTDLSEQPLHKRSERSNVGFDSWPF